MSFKFLFTVLSSSLFSSIVWASPPVVDGLVYLEGPGEFCSGSLFAQENFDKNQKALVLTNGHCTGMGSTNLFGMTFPSTTERINYVTADNMSLYVLKKDAVGVMENAVDLNFELDAQVLVATMYKKDIAIYQVKYTYAELEAAGYRPLILAKKTPALSSKVIYHSSAWGTQITCDVDGYADTVIEGFWVWNNVIRMTGQDCTAQGGASGSPVLDTDGRIVSIMNTMYENGEKCTIMNPCERERDSGTASVINGAVYSIPVVDLNSCFDQNKKIDLQLCGLGK